jgi:hypothetical protein
VGVLALMAEVQKQFKVHCEFIDLFIPNSSENFTFELRESSRG